jgi:DNA polymerase-3 subunit delta'
MKINNDSKSILDPKQQLNLYGYKDYFNSFIKLYKKNKFHNTMLFTGAKGLGKSTFAYHLVNYLLSEDELNSYDIQNLIINSENSSYNLLLNKVHPNFFSLESTSVTKEIKIDDVRKLLKFLNTTVYSKNIKIVLIDNAEFLNQNSSNALLKALEEPSNNTFFFIITSSASKVLNTIASRCTEYKFHFSQKQKINIFTKMLISYNYKITNNNMEKFLTFETQGNLLRYLSSTENANLDIFDDNLSSIYYLIDKYKSKKENDLLDLISLSIESYYNELCLKGANINQHIFDRYKILYLINNLKKFNLDKKNSLICIEGILLNAQR